MSKSVHYLLAISAICGICSFIPGSNSPIAQTAAPVMPQQQAAPSQVQQQAPGQSNLMDPQMMAAAKSADGWLQLADQGNYEGSWEAGSLTLKLTIPRKEWVEIMNATRRPLGRVVSRKLLDIQPAPNPKNLPAGLYAVILYQTEFGAAPKGMEVVTLQENQGAWRVLTYQVSAGN